jgi:hypothetical protein
VLPDFSARELTKGKIQISWENPFPSCIQLAIQRSADSSKNFRTIFSSQSPELPSNGFVDNKPLASARSYYRIFYVLKGGDYYFSKVRTVETTAIPPVTEKPVTKPIPVPKPEKPKEESKGPAVKIDMVTIYLKKTELFRFTRAEYLHFRDSINTKTKDALHKINDHAVEWKPSKKSNKKELTIVYGPDGVMRELNKKSYLKFKDSVFAKTKDSLTRLDEWHVQFRPFVPKAKEYIDIYINDNFLMEVESGLYKKFKDSMANKTKDTVYSINKTRSDIHPFIPKPKEFIQIYRNDSLLVRLEAALYKRFRDSVAVRTKDTIYSVDNNRADIHPFIPKYIWKPSVYVYTNAQGYVSIVLPLFKQHKYHIIFYEEDGSELFRIKTIKDGELVLDKANFIHAGWFYFELFEDDKLKEKSKFQLFRD